MYTKYISICNVFRQAGAPPRGQDTTAAASGSGAPGEGGEREAGKRLQVPFVLK